MSIKRLTLAAIALLAATPAIAAKLPADLAKAAAAFDQAQIDGDRAALERLLADDYVLVNSRAVVCGKAEQIRDNTAPGFKLDPFVVRESVERVWANGAVLGGLVELSGLDGGKPFKATLRFADIWAKRQGVWRVVYTEVTRPPAS